MKALEYHPNSVGYLSQFFHSAGQALPSTLVMPSKTLVFYLSDEIFAIHAPILVTIDARSTTILNIELASDRSAETWRAHFEALENHHFVSLGMASDRGLGLVAGYQAACDMALWVADYFHEFRDLFEVLHQVERKAYTAIDKEYDAMQGSLHVPKARPISTNACTTMTPRITPVNRPWHSTTTWPCCFTCCVKPYTYARLMADCAPKNTCDRN